MSAAGIIHAIEARAPIHQAALVLVAHPDDEVLGLSVLLGLLTRLTLVHATDGAAGGDQHERARELDAALVQLGIIPHRRIRLDLPDGALAGNMANLLAQLAPLWDDHEVIVTHAFEGGHPDHDCCALAVDTLREMLGDKITLGFPVYAVGSGGRVTNRFVREPSLCARITLDVAEMEAKRCALAEFVSQAHVIQHFDLAAEAIGALDPVNPARLRPVGEVLFAHDDQIVSDAWHSAVMTGIVKWAASTTLP